MLMATWEDSNSNIYTSPISLFIANLVIDYLNYMLHKSVSHIIWHMHV